MTASNLGATLGAIEIAVVLSAILLGINILQTYSYYRTYPADRIALKVLVGTVCILDTVNTVLQLYALYHWTIVYFGVADEIINSPPTLSASVLCAGVITFLVQCFFSYRVWILTRHVFLTTICVIGATGRFILYTFVTSKVLILVNLLVAKEKLKPVIESSAVTGPVVDWFIAGTLCITLARNMSGLEKTDKIIDKIIVYTMGTGFMTGILVLLEFITFVSMPNNFIWIAIVVMDAKVFSNSLMVSLNARGLLRKQMSHTYLSSGRPTVPLNIEITRQTDIVIEMPDAHRKLDSTMNSRPGNNFAAHYRL